MFAMKYIAPMALAAAFAAAQSAAAFSCKPKLSVYGPSFLTIVEAHHASILQWSVTAAAKYGTAYSDWKFAVRSPQYCRQNIGSLGITVWICQQRAKPCKP